MLTVALAACGSGVPGNGVVRVDDGVIKKSTFNHWLRIAALSSQPPGSGPKPVIPDPPNFTRCVAAARRTSANPPKGQPKPTEGQLKAQCKQQYQGLRDQVLGFLIQYEWFKGEASDLGIKVTQAEVQKSFQQQKRQSFPSDKEFENFLRSSGFTMPDILLRVRSDLLANKIRDKVIKGKGNVTQQQVAAYYNKNKQRFAQPERRDLRVVLTKTRAKARQARAALARGQSFAKVAKRYSTDQSSKSEGGRLRDVTPGQQEKALDTAVFRARKGRLEGPVKTQFGYYIFKVTKITPGSQQSLAQASATIRQLLRSQNEQKAITKYVKDFQKKWKGRTNCRKGYVVETCKNAPKPKRNTTSTPPGAVPQGGTPGTPQGGQGTPVQPPQGQAPAQP